MDKQYISGETGHGFSAKSANTGHYAQLNTYDYLADIPNNSEVTDLVEVQFKNTRKAYFHNCDNLPLKKGDIVAVESNPGHDIGVVSLTGKPYDTMQTVSGYDNPSPGSLKEFGVLYNELPMIGGKVDMDGINKAMK